VTSNNESYVTAALQSVHTKPQQRQQQHDQHTMIVPLQVE
jgi:hypothetical protein